MRVVALLLVLVIGACSGDDRTQPVPADQAGGSVSSPTTAAGTTAVTTAATLTVSPDDVVAGPDTCAHVIGVEASTDGSGEYSFAVTVRSDDRGWDKYADAWEVRTPDDEVLGVRTLAHPHEAEQPFTRSLSGVSVPAEVERVEVFARDSVLGFCGDSYSLSLSE